MSTASLPDLWPRIQAGDESAFEEVFRAYYSDLCRFAHRYTLDPQQSEDLVQDVFFKFWQSASTLELRTAMRPYLYQSVRNACLNHIKHLKVRTAYAEGQSGASGVSENESELWELEQRINDAIGRLPEKCREIFELSRFAGLKYQQIADELGISVKTVENQMGKALRLLREELSDYMPLIVVGAAGVIYLIVEIGVNIHWVVL
ncbi:RNA polymerase sigma-70 factor [Cryomorphaceae bacterium]|nr:RNA polymerase sigma-70 factor [Cryomorphaceae bacterium]